MRNYKRWSHNKIFELLQQTQYLSRCELDYWIMLDYTDAQILRRSAPSTRSKRTINRGLFFIKRSMTQLSKFKKIKAKLVLGGLKIES